MLNVKIVSTGLYLPPSIQTAADLSPLIGKSEKWITSRTGVKERRIASETMAEMAAKAAKQALGDGPPPDCILNASTTPMQLIPDSSVFIQRELGYDGIPCWSTHATCLSFLVALMTGASYINAGIYKRVLVVSSEAGSPFRDMQEPESAALFGDGAAAVVLEPTPDGETSGIIDFEMNSWPDGAELTEFRGAGTQHPPNHPTKTGPKDNLFQMKGVKVYRFARDSVKKTFKTMFDRTNMTANDFDLIIPHQASGRGVEAAQEYGFAAEKVVNIVDKFGNCIAASMPMALAMANAEGRLKRGDKFVMGGTGAGLSVAFIFIQW